MANHFERRCDTSYMLRVGSASRLPNFLYIHPTPTQPRPTTMAIEFKNIEAAFPDYSDKPTWSLLPLFGIQSLDYVPLAWEAESCLHPRSILYIDLCRLTTEVHIKNSICMLLELRHSVSLVIANVILAECNWRRRNDFWETGMIAIKFAGVCGISKNSVQWINDVL